MVADAAYRGFDAGWGIINILLRAYQLSDQRSQARNEVRKWENDEGIVSVHVTLANSANSPLTVIIGQK